MLAILQPLRATQEVAGSSGVYQNSVHPVIWSPLNLQRCRRWQQLEPPVQLCMARCFQWLIPGITFPPYVNAVFVDSDIPVQHKQKCMNWEFICRRSSPGFMASQLESFQKSIGTCFHVFFLTDVISLSDVTHCVHQALSRWMMIGEILSLCFSDNSACMCVIIYTVAARLILNSPATVS